MEPEPGFFAGAGAAENEPPPRCCCATKVMRWQSCDNSNNFSQMITIVTQIKRKSRYAREAEPGIGAGRMTRSQRLDRLHNTESNHYKYFSVVVEISFYSS